MKTSKITKNKTIKGYRLSKWYKTLTIWEFSRLTNTLICTHTIKCEKGMTNRERYDQLCKVVVDIFGFCAVYNPTR
jgi:hypothetical protein